MKNAERSIPPGALVSFLQKGLQYVGIEETLVREQLQRGNANATNSNKKNKAGAGNGSGSNSSSGASLGSGGAPSSSTDGTAINLSLLSPTTIHALIRENPPLHLNVPPATAAAAVRARLEAEAQIEADRKKVAIMEAQVKAEAEAQSNGGKSSTRLTGPLSIPPQPANSATLTNPLKVANAAAAAAQSSNDVQKARALAQAQAQAQAQAAVSAMNQLQHQQHHHHRLLPQNNPLPQHQQQQQQQQQQQGQSQQQQQQQQKSAADSAGAAARTAQQRSQMALDKQLAIEKDNQNQLIKQMQLRQQQLQHLSHNLPAMNTAQAQAQAQAVATQAAVAEQMGNNMNNNNSNSNSINSNKNNNVVTSVSSSRSNSNGSSSSNSSGNKRPSSAKKGPKNKGKSAKQQKTVHQQQPQASTQGESTLNSSAPLLAAPQNNGIEYLREALVQQLESGTAVKHQSQLQHQIQKQLLQQQQQQQQHQQQQQQQQEHQRQLQQDAMNDTAQQNGIASAAAAVATGEENDHRPHHRHLQHRNLQQNVRNQMQPMSTLQQQAVVQELITRNNGKHMQGEIQNLNGSSEQQHQQQPQPQPAPNGAISSSNIQTEQPTATAQQQQAAVAATSQVLSPKEAAKAVNAKIDKEDVLTNAKLSKVLELKLHQSEVFMCAWNSVYTDMIATGSGDASARIWKMGGPKAANGLGAVNLLPHGTGPSDQKNKDVTTLEWSSDGKLLATGSYDGVARVWSMEGKLVHILKGHKGPIFSLKWNKKGNYLLSGSYDKTTIVWDVSSVSGHIKQQFEDHQAPALDVDWKDDNTFASCSTDKTVHICQVGHNFPLKTYSGHTDEVNAVKWDPSGCLLASCSDDCTAKVWDVKSDRKDPMYNFKSHQQEIYTVKWAPTGAGSKNPKKKPLLATASFDGSVRLWNIEDGTCIQVFSRHRDSVYSVAFSPSGNYLASGSLAGQLYIWNVLEGRHIKSFKGKGDIFEVAWNKEETRVAACFSSNVVCILDFP